MLLTLFFSGKVQASVTLDGNNFPDANFRAALASYAVNGVIDETTLTELDVSNRGITDITGVELLTALTKFVAANNDIQFVKLTGNPHLEWLDLSGNDDLIGFRNPTTYPPSSTNHNMTLTTGMPLTHLDLSNCDIGYFQLLATTWGVTSLTWLSLAGDTRMAGWSSGIAAQTGLVHCDLTNTGQTSTSVAFTSAHSSIETLILKDNALGGAVSCLQYLTNLKYLDMSNTSQTQYSTLGLTSAHTKLETLKLGGNSSFAYSSSFRYLRALKYLDISNCDIIFRAGGLLDYLTPGNNPNLETLLCSSSRLGTRTEGLDNFTKLKKVDVSGNVTTSTINMTQFWVNGSPLLDTLDISGNTALTYLKLNDDNLPRTDFHLIGGSDCTALNSLYLNGNNYAIVSDATDDFTSISNLAFLYLENNSGFTGGDFTLTATDCGTLTGLDLGNNGFTGFSAPDLPASLTALMLGDNPGMTRLEMHNNPGITTMTASPVMSDGSGLYLLGNTALTYMDISGTEEQPNHFQRIGNNSSLNGVPIVTLKASYNKFYTFRNLTAVSGNIYERFHKSTWEYSSTATPGLPDPDTYYSAYWYASPAQTDSASLEQLTGLEYLDLSHCQLKDSVYLHKNTELRYLDVSHNRTIDRYSTPHNKGAEYLSYSDGTIDKITFEDYKKYIWLKNDNNNGLEPYTGDYNDTTGLYVLDLLDNNKLEYLDISYTGIEQTALTHCHVALARYVWIQDLPNLKYFYADYNGMRSMGVSTKRGRKYREGLASLERLSAIGMRGGDDVTMMGSINLHGDVNTKLHYVNFSYSDYDSIGCGAIYVDSVRMLPMNTVAYKLDTLIIKGNPIHYLDVQFNDSITYIDATDCAFKMRGYDPETGNTFPPDANRYKNGARVGGQYYETSTNNYDPNARRTSYGVITSPFSGLRAIRAHHRPKLTTVKLNKCNALQEVYCHYDPELVKIEGFEDPHFNSNDKDSLLLVWVNDDYKLIELNLSESDSLRYLHAYNDKVLGDALDTDGMDLRPNQKLITAWVSNSHLQRFQNGAATLDTLKIWDNPKLAQLEVTGDTLLRYLDLRNCRVRDLDMSKCGILTYFDCKNDSIKGNYEDKWYGFDLPRAVPLILGEEGKNSIADLHFSSKALKYVGADRNDLFNIDGLAGNDSLKTLTYSYNHINAIDLTGCDNIVDSLYDCTHNGRGVIEAEYSKFRVKNGNAVDTCHMYYLQLDPNAGDELDPLHHDSYLGYKEGHDSIESAGSGHYFRKLHDDNFVPGKVKQFVTNSSGPYKGSRGNNNNNNSAQFNSQVPIGSDSAIDTTLIYGTIAVLDVTNNPGRPGYHYIEYEYLDGRQSVSKAGQGKTSTFYLVWSAPPAPTELEEISDDSLLEPTVVSERYYDISGAEHSGPIDGVNIIVRQMSDGTTQTLKIVR